MENPMDSFFGLHHYLSWQPYAFFRRPMSCKYRPYDYSVFYARHLSPTLSLRRVSKLPSLTTTLLSTVDSVIAKHASEMQGKDTAVFSHGEHVDSIMSGYESAVGDAFDVRNWHSMGLEANFSQVASATLLHPKHATFASLFTWKQPSGFPWTGISSAFIPKRVQDFGPNSKLFKGPLTSLDSKTLSFYRHLCIDRSAMLAVWDFLDIEDGKRIMEDQIPDLVGQELCLADAGDSAQVTRTSKKRAMENFDVETSFWMLPVEGQRSSVQPRISSPVRALRRPKSIQLPSRRSRRIAHLASRSLPFLRDDDDSRQQEPPTEARPRKRQRTQTTLSSEESSEALNTLQGVRAIIRTVFEPHADTGVAALASRRTYRRYCSGVEQRQPRVPWYPPSRIPDSLHL